MSISPIINNKTNNNIVNDSLNNLSSSSNGAGFGKILKNNQGQTKSHNSDYDSNDPLTRTAESTEPNENTSGASNNNSNVLQKLDKNSPQASQRNSESDANDKEKKFQEDKVDAEDSAQSQAVDSQEVSASVATSQDDDLLLYQDIENALNQEQPLDSNINIESNNSHEAISESAIIAVESSSVQDPKVSSVILQQQGEQTDSRLTDLSNKSVLDMNYLALEYNSEGHELLDAQNESQDNPEKEERILSLSDNSEINIYNVPNNFETQRTDTQFDKPIDNIAISLKDINSLPNNTTSNKDPVESEGESFPTNNTELDSSRGRLVSDININKPSSVKTNNLDETNKDIELSSSRFGLPNTDGKFNEVSSETLKLNLDPQSPPAVKTDKLIDYSLAESGANLSIKNDKMIVSFTETTGSIGNSTPNSSNQIAMAVKTAVDNQRSEIVLNMYPENLGSVDIQIEFNEASKIQSIKILVNNKETLEILEKDRVFLEKTLSEVGKTADSSLSFNLKDGRNDNNNYQPQDHLNLANQKQDDEKIVNRNYGVTTNSTQDDRINITV